MPESSNSDAVLSTMFWCGVVCICVAVAFLFGEAVGFLLFGVALLVLTIVGCLVERDKSKHEVRTKPKTAVESSSDDTMSRLELEAMGWLRATAALVDIDDIPFHKPVVVSVELVPSVFESSAKLGQYCRLPGRFIRVNQFKAVSCRTGEANGVLVNVYLDGENGIVRTVCEKQDVEKGDNINVCSFDMGPV